MSDEAQATPEVTQADASVVAPSTDVAAPTTQIEVTQETTPDQPQSVSGVRDGAQEKTDETIPEPVRAAITYLEKVVHEFDADGNVVGFHKEHVDTPENAAAREKELATQAELAAKAAPDTGTVPAPADATNTEGAA